MSNGSAVAGPKPRDWSRDGWYDDEFAPSGKVNPTTKCQFNKFNDPPDFDTARSPSSNIQGSQDTVVSTTGIPLSVGSHVVSANAAAPIQLGSGPTRSTSRA